MYYFHLLLSSSVSKSLGVSCSDVKYKPRSPWIFFWSLFYLYSVCIQVDRCQFPKADFFSNNRTVLETRVHHLRVFILHCLWTVNRFSVMDGEMVGGCGWKLARRRAQMKEGKLMNGWSDAHQSDVKWWRADESMRSCFYWLLSPIRGTAAFHDCSSPFQAWPFS